MTKHVAWQHIYIYNMTECKQGLMAYGYDIVGEQRWARNGLGPFT